jgi:glycosyltransferase involved in cell wall biosynthesis
VKIVLVTTIYPPDIGGPATYAWDVSRRLRARGHEVTVVSSSVTPADPGVLHPPAWLRRVRFVRGATNSLFLLRLLLRAGRKSDVFYVQHPGHVGLLTVLAARILRKPVVMRYPGDVAWERTFARGGTTKTLHEFLRAPEGGWRMSLMMRIQRAVAAGVDQVVTPSEYIRGALIEAYGVQPDRIRAIYHSLEIDDFAQSVPRNDGSGPLILNVGRLVRHKRITDLVAALNRVAAVFPGVRVDVVGEGPQQAALQEQAEKEQVADRIRFLGQVSRARALELMAGADLLVLPSLWESLSHVAIEAIAVGVPVVATEIPGLNEVLEHEVTALLVPPCDPGALAQAIVRMAGDGELRERLVRNGRAAARRRFTWEANLPALESVLGAAIAGRAAGSPGKQEMKEERPA